MILDVTVTTPPKGKQRPRLGRGRRVYTPQATVAFERAIARAVRKSVDAPRPEPMTLVVDAYFKRRAKPPRGHVCHGAPPEPFPFAMGGAYPDADNILKAVADALNGVVYFDDAQLFDVRCRRWWAAECEPSSLRIRVAVMG